MIEELIEVEEVASQMQELEKSREEKEPPTFPVTMQIFSPVRVRIRALSGCAHAIHPEEV